MAQSTWPRARGAGDDRRERWAGAAGRSGARRCPGPERPASRARAPRVVPAVADLAPEARHLDPHPRSVVPRPARAAVRADVGGAGAAVVSGLPDHGVPRPRRRALRGLETAMGQRPLGAPRDVVLLR